MSNYGYQSGHYGGPPGGPQYSSGPPQPPTPQQHQQPYYHHQQQQQQQQQQPQQNYGYSSPPPNQPQQPYGSVVAPSPVHARPHMPDQISSGLHRLDLNTSNVGPTPPPGGVPSAYSSPSSAYTPHPQSGYAGYDSPGAQPPAPLNVAQRASAVATPQPQSQQGAVETSYPGLPKLPFRTQNIPEPDDDRGTRLERDRLAILGSTNFEDQLGWAQDALNWVDGATEQDARLAQLGQGRSVQPAIERQLRTDAINVTEHMATQHHPRATFMKGMWLEFGKFGYPEDKREAFEYYSRAARNGYARAEYRIGMQFEATGSPVQALQHYRAGEAAGDAASCYRMGMVFALGQLQQPQDFARAVALIRTAAENADDNAPQGAYVYGMLLAKDLPQIKIPEQYLQHDVDAAKRYIEKSAWLGFSKAQLKMASAYEVASLHCEVNPLLSMHYNALAARQGEPEGDMALSKWFVVGSEGSFPKDERLAYLYAERAAGSGLPIAYFALGYFNEVGAGTPPNVEQARMWYGKAAAEGNTEGRDALQRLSNNQTLSMQHHEDVTLNRIRSTHGSRRAAHPPQHLQKPPPPMPTVPDEYAPPGGAYPPAAAYVRPPDPAPTPPRVASGPQQPPLRTQSAAPYPLDDHPPMQPQYRPPPGAAAPPYPGADPRPNMPNAPPPAGYPPHPQSQQYGQPPPPATGYGNAPPRPYSNGHGPPPPQAQQQRPGPGPGPGAYAGPGAPQGAHPPPVRTHPSATPTPPLGNRPPPGRIPSGPPGAGPGPGQGPGPGPGPGYPGSSNAPTRPPKEPVLPNIPGPSGPGHAHTMPAQPGRPASAATMPNAHPSAGPPRVNSTPSLAPSLPAVGASSRPGSSAGPRPAPGPSPRPASSVPVPRPGAGAGSGSSGPTGGIPGGGAGGMGGGGKPSSAPAAPRPTPAGSGPKTFDQMGVPAAKNESECVVM